MNTLQRFIWKEWVVLEGDLYYKYVLCEELQDCSRIYFPSAVSPEQVFFCF